MPLIAGFGMLIHTKSRRTILNYCRRAYCNLAVVTKTKKGRAASLFDEAALRVFK